YFRGFTFRNTTTGKYRLEITVPKDKKNTSLAMATRKFNPNEIQKSKKDVDGFTTVKMYNIDKNTHEYTMVLSETTGYRFTIESEDEITMKVVDEEGKEYINYAPKVELDNKIAWMFGEHPTGIYYLKIDKKGVNPATINLAFKQKSEQLLKKQGIDK
uniref:hypothetical protein n=1 Tax=Bernardetia sp. TaxID=1937974 RepID=UPI0025BF8C34